MNWILGDKTWPRDMVPFGSFVATTYDISDKILRIYICVLIAGEKKFAEIGTHFLWGMDSMPYLTELREVVPVSEAQKAVPFYMNYMEGGSTPCVQHKTIGEARAEAERLARNNHGKKVYVLKPVISMVQPPQKLQVETL